MKKTFWERFIAYFDVLPGSLITRKQMHRDFKIDPKRWDQGTLLDSYRRKLENMGYIKKGQHSGTYVVLKPVPSNLSSTGKLK